MSTSEASYRKELELHSQEIVELTKRICQLEKRNQKLQKLIAKEQAEDFIRTQSASSKTPVSIVMPCLNISIYTFGEEYGYVEDILDLGTEGYRQFRMNAVEWATFCRKLKELGIQHETIDAVLKADNSKTPIGELNKLALSARTRRHIDPYVKRTGAKYVEDLLDLGEDGYVAIRHIGIASWRDFCQCCSDMGIKHSTIDAVLAN